MSASDVVTRLVWGLRRYWWLLLPLLVLAGAAVVLAGPGSPVRGATYQARALVVARDLDIWHEQVPRLTRAFFDSGAVAEQVAAATGAEADTLIPERLRLEPVEETVAVHVVGRERSAEAAAELANAGAQVLVAELNRPGEGFGEFIVQDQARPPAGPMEDDGSAGVFAAAGIAVLALWVGLVGLLVAHRDPVLTLGDAIEAASAPVLGAVGHLGRVRAPSGMVGLSALAARLYPDGDGAWALVGCGEDSLRVRLLGGLAGLLGIDRAPRGAGADPGGASGDRAQRAVDGADAPPPPRRQPRLFDAGQARDRDVAQAMPPGWPVALVISEGARARDVRRAAAQLPPNRLEGVVLAYPRAPRAAAPLPGASVDAGLTDRLRAR